MGFFRNIVARAASWAGLPVIVSRGGLSNTMGKMEEVDDDLALKISTVWSCVRLISDWLLDPSRFMSRSASTTAAESCGPTTR